MTRKTARTSSLVLLFLVAVMAAGSPGAEDHGRPTPPRPTLAKPLLIGEWADIAVLKDGADYYLVHSSGWYRPAVLIWHSKDLRSWRPLRYAVKEFDKGAIWLTDLAKVDGHYYIFFLNSFSWQSGGYVTTADSIDGPWSPPRPTGLHPDAVLAADDAGKRYLFTGNGYLTPLMANRVEAAHVTGRNNWLGDADLFRFDPVQARYVRLHCTERAVTWQAYTVFEFGVFEAIPECVRATLQ